MDDLKKLISEYLSPSTGHEVLKFMTETEQRKAYDLYLESGNYNTFSAFIEEFKEGIFDAATGKPIDLVENPHKTPLRDLEEAGKGKGDDAADLSQVLVKARISLVDFYNKYDSELPDAIKETFQDLVYLIEFVNEKLLWMEG